MKKTLVIMSLILAMLFALVGCGSSETTTTPTNPPAENSTDTSDNSAVEETTKELKAVTMKVGHTLSSTHPTQTVMEEMARVCSELSGGKITIDIYPNSVLGSELSMIQQVMDGSLDAHIQTGLATFANFNPLANIENMPFLWKTEEAARQAVDNEFGQLFTSEVMEPLGFHVLCFWENGYRHLTNDVRPIVVPSDLEGLKIRVAEIPLRVQLFESLGASAVPIGFNELFSALQQGTVDGQENPLSNIASSNFDEVQTYLSLSGHLFNTGVFYVNQDFWNSLEPEAQAIITEAACAARDAERQMLDEMMDGLVEELENRGMVVNEVEKQQFIDMLQPMYDQYVADNGDIAQQILDAATKYNDAA